MDNTDKKICLKLKIAKVYLGEVIQNIEKGNYEATQDLCIASIEKIKEVIEEMKKWEK